MVAEDGVGGPRQPCEQSAEPLLARTAREQVAAQADQVGLALGRPLHRALDGDPAPRGKAEMEVGQVHDAEAVELGRQPVELDLERAQPDPPGLEPAPGDGRACGAARAADQTCNFSSTGLTETT